jgi:hypothetical protein
MKRFFIAILCAMLAPLAAAQQPAPAVKGAAKKKAEPLADTRKTIGLIPEIGGKFSVQQIGIMVFGNEKNEVPIESWGIDTLVIAKVTSALKARFNVIPLKLSKENEAALEKAPGSLFGDRKGYICNLLRKETLGQPLNYYLRVVPSESQYGSTNQHVRGLGIVHRQGFDTGYTFVHALFQLTVLDGATCEQLRWELPPSSQGFLFADIHGPSREVEASWMPSPANAAQDARLRDATRTLVEDGLMKTIPKLFAAQ